MDDIKTQAIIPTPPNEPVSITDNFHAVCQDCATYIKEIYKPICFHPTELTVTVKLNDFAHFIIEGNQRDDGVLIGRSGSTVQAVRLFVHAFSKSKMEGIPCIVEVRDHGISRYNPVNPTNNSRPPTYARKIRR